MKLFIGCSQNDEIPNKYFIDCKKYLDELFSLDNELVFGGCGKGLMNEVYTAAKEKGRKITGVSTDYYVEDIKKLNCDDVYIEKNETSRHNKLIELADAIIFLPGGIGTVSEIFTSIEGKRAREYDKPIIIYNSEHYYDKLIEFIDGACEDKFISKEVEDLFHISNDAMDTLKYLSKLTNR